MSIILPENLQAARHLFQAAFPYFTHFHWSMVPVAAPGLGTMATDRYWRLYVDVEAVKSWPVEECVLALLHEVTHIINKHHTRLDDNIAADLAVNSWITDMIPSANQKLAKKKINLKLADNPSWLHADKYGFPRGLSLEEYHALLEEKRQKAQSMPMPSPSRGGKKDEKNPGPPPLQPPDLKLPPESKKDEDKGDSGSGQGDESEAGSDGDQEDGGGSGKEPEIEKPSVGQGRCGSCARPKHEPWELPSPEDGGPPGLSPEQVEVRIKQTAQKIEEHRKTIGNVPGCLERWAHSELLPPTIHWTQELAGAVRYAMAWAAGASYKTWRTLSRRAHADILFPGQANPIPSVAMVVDTSGSMSEDNLADCLAEGQGVIRACGLNLVPVLAVDSSINVCKRVLDMKRMPLVGGGGTDMSLGIVEAAKLRPKPQVIIVLTDGYTGYPAEPPRGTKVIVVLVTNGAQDPPSWARTIRVHKEN